MPQSFLPLKPADQHTSTNTTHQGSAGRWEEHHGERDGRSLARPLSPHHPASPSQQERALNQRSKREEGSEGREREERRREGRKRQMQNELMRGSRGSRVLKRSHEMYTVFNFLLTCVSGCISCLCLFYFFFFFTSFRKVQNSVHWTTLLTTISFIEHNLPLRRAFAVTQVRSAFGVFFFFFLNSDCGNTHMSAFHLSLYSAYFWILINIQIRSLLT